MRPIYNAPRGGRPTLAEQHGDNLNALAWMRKDHTATAEAQATTRLARERQPQLVSNIGGSYSSEWYWAKVLHCAKVNPTLHAEIHDWVEFADYIPALLVDRSEAPPRDVCAAGHKMLYRPGAGFPPDDFLDALHLDLLRFKRQLERCELKYAGESIGTLSPEWQQKFGFGAHVRVSAGAFDAHLGAVGSGVRRLEEFGVPVREVVACGGIAEKNAVMMQIYADVLGKDIQVSESSQTPALGAAIAAATAAGHYPSMREAERHMVPQHRTTYRTCPDHHATYACLYQLYSELHD